MKKLITIKNILKKAISFYLEDNGPRLGASLGFYALLSLSPLLILLVSVLSPLAGSTQIRQEILLIGQRYLGPVGLELLSGMLNRAQEISFGHQAIMGLFTLLMAASLVFNELQNIVNQLWHVDHKRRNKIKQVVYNRLRSFLVVLAFAPILMVFFLSRTILFIMAKWTDANIIPTGFPLLAMGEWFLATFVLMIMFTLLFMFLPERKLKFVQIWPGPLLSALLFVIGRYLIGLYLTRPGVVSMYGITSSLVFFLFWVYYSGQVFLFGVELSKSYALSMKNFKLD